MASSARPGVGMASKAEKDADVVMGVCLMLGVSMMDCNR